MSKRMHSIKQQVDQFSIAEVGQFNIAANNTAIIHELLYQAGYNDIKLKQVFRHIRFLPYHPRQISFCKVQHNSKQKITKDEAIKRLKEVGQGENIDVQLNKLQSCDSTHYIVHRETGAQWAANIATFKNGDNRSMTTKILTSLPIIYLHSNDFPEPIIKYAEKRKNRSIRKDRKIEKVPFLPSIHAYKCQ